MLIIAAMMLHSFFPNFHHHHEMLNMENQLYQLRAQILKHQL